MAMGQAYFLAYPQTAGIQSGVGPFNGVDHPGVAVDSLGNGHKGIAMPNDIRAGVMASAAAGAAGRAIKAGQRSCVAGVVGCGVVIKARRSSAIVALRQIVAGIGIGWCSCASGKIHRNLAA